MTVQKFSPWARLGILIGLFLAGWSVCVLAAFGAVQLARLAGLIQ